MPRKSTKDQIALLEVRTKTAPCVPAIRGAVAAWREKDYPGITQTTRQLLNHWFKTDHRLRNGQMFRYHDAQREAIETLIYLYEVAGVRRHKELVETYATNTPNLRLLQYDDFARYCVKMATGSGKTKVMALAILWHYFNAVAEGRDDYARTFLVIAPNVIVFERLRSDFAGGRIFRADPMIPPELDIFWDMECYLRGDGERASSQGALYLTNVQQLYDRPDTAKQTEPDAMTAVLGHKPAPARGEADDVARRIAERGAPCLVLNDEAHHTHDEESEWNKVIRRLDGDLARKTHPLPPHDTGGDSLRLPSPIRGGVGGGAGVVTQLDVTATPRYSKGALFTWTVFDYPLKQAILDGLVKRPMKGVAVGIHEQPSDLASVKYQAYLTAGVERWRAYREQLEPLDKKPILFVMLNSTVEADDVGDYLRTKYPAEFGGAGLLIIHTDNTGEVSKRDLDAARTLAREVDEATSPVNAIVSVLMLREGWDVQNVTVIVGLRPYTSKANILPEQTIGRGLRRMFRELGNTYTERVDVIGNKAFLEFVTQLEQDEDIALDEFDLEKDKVVIVTIAPDPAKMDKDLTIPELSPILARKKTLAEEIGALDIAAMACPALPKKEQDAAAQSFHYEGYDIISLEKLVEADYTIPQAQTAQEVISYYAKRIAQEVKLPSQFAALAPKVREFLETRAFGSAIDIETPAMIKAISSNVAQYVTVRTFVAALRAVIVEELSPSLLHAGRALSAMRGFATSRPTITAQKTVFNLIPCENNFEKRFAQFLESAPDVAAFAKLPEQFGFRVEYTDTVGNLRYYEPDFVALLADGTHALIETKGREDTDVARKDRAAIIWCENATLLTEMSWRYIKVPQKGFEQLHADEFADLAVLAPSGLLA
jgi:type III restriction enzyme